MKAIEEWLRPLAYQGGNERDENATDEPECPFSLDDNDDQAIEQLREQSAQDRP